jgi:hypothetical protein
MSLTVEDLYNRLYPADGTGRPKPNASFVTWMHGEILRFQAEKKPELLDHHPDSGRPFLNPYEVFRYNYPDMLSDFAMGMYLATGKISERNSVYNPRSIGRKKADLLVEIDSFVEEDPRYLPFLVDAILRCIQVNDRLRAVKQVEQGMARLTVG